MDARPIAARLEQLRKDRVAKSWAGPVGPGLEAERRLLVKQSKKLGGVAGAWDAVCPAGLVSRTAIDGLSRGILRVRVSDSAVGYELDRALRSGGLDALAKKSPTTVRRVKIVVGLHAGEG